MGDFRLNTLIVLTLTAILMVAQPVRANSGKHSIDNLGRFLAFSDDYRTKKKATKLQVNRHSEFRIVVPNKCKNRGEAELRQLAATEVFEESYVYIPSLCLWIEVGYDEARRRVRLDSKFIVSLLKDFDRLFIYHIHMGAPLQISGYFPAYKDLVSLILINAKFFRNPEIQISHRVVIDNGIIDYVFRASPATDLLIDKFNRTGLGDFTAQNLAFFFAQNEYKEHYYTKIHECEHLIGGYRENLSECFPMATDDFRLTYRKLDPYSTARIQELNE